MNKILMQITRTFWK